MSEEYFYSHYYGPTDKYWTPDDERQSKARLTKINEDGTLGDIQYFVIQNGSVEFGVAQEIKKKIEFFKDFPKTISMEMEFTDVDPELIKLLIGEHDGTGDQDTPEGLRGQGRDEGRSGDRTSSELLDGQEHDDQDQ